MPSSLLLALLAGSALACQNAVMLAMLRRGLTILPALITNSLVGLVLLSGIALMRTGPGVVHAIAQPARPWFILPGLLGSFVVFATLFSYRQQGAAATIALVFAAQVTTGLLLDATGLLGTARVVTGERGLAMGLLLAGALLLARGD